MASAHHCLDTFKMLTFKKCYYIVQCVLGFFFLFQEREVDFFAKEFELAKERQAEFLGDRYITLHFFNKKLSHLLLIKKN